MDTTAVLWTMIAVMALDILLPIWLGRLWPGYNPQKTVMSVLGSQASPVRGVYNFWLVMGGLLFGFGAAVLCRTLGAGQKALPTVILVLLLLFALGAMILSGMFSVNEGKAMRTTAEKIHGIGASIGFTALLLVPVLLAVLAAGTVWAPVYALCFLLGAAAFTLFIMADKPRFKGTWVDKEGLWQRLTLLVLYLAVALCCLMQMQF